MAPSSTTMSPVVPAFSDVGSSSSTVGNCQDIGVAVRDAETHRQIERRSALAHGREDRAVLDTDIRITVGDEEYLARPTILRRREPECRRSWYSCTQSRRPPKRRYVWAGGRCFRRGRPFRPAPSCGRRPRSNRRINPGVAVGSGRTIGQISPAHSCRSCRNCRG